MYFVYVLKDKNGKFYKGQTNNLERRLKEHNTNHTRTTSRMSDSKLVYSETFSNREESLKREKYFKSAAGRKFLKKILED